MTASQGLTSWLASTVVIAAMVSLSCLPLSASAAIADSSGVLMAQSSTDGGTVNSGASGSELEAIQSDLDAKNYASAESRARGFLTQEPDNEDALFLLGRSLSMQGKTDDALTQFDKLLTISPKNVDYLLGKSLLLTKMDRPNEAVELLNQAIEISPDYEELYRAKLNALAEAGNRQELDQFIAQAQEKFPNSKWEAPEEAVTMNKDDADAAAPPKVELPKLEVESGFGYNNLNNNFANWNNQYLFIKKEFKPRLSLYTNLRRTRRFDFNDYEGLIGATAPLGKRITLTGEASATPNADVLPRNSIGGGLNVALPAGFGASIFYRHVNYQTGTVDNVTYGIEKYLFKRLRLGYTLFSSKLRQGDWAYAHLFRGDYYYHKNKYGQNSSFGVGYNFGDEQQNLGVTPAGLPSILDIFSRGATFSGIHWFAPTWGLTYVVLLQSLDNNTSRTALYKNRGFQIGLRHVF